MHFLIVFSLRFIYDIKNEFSYDYQFEGGDFLGSQSGFGFSQPCFSSSRFLNSAC